MTFSKSIRLNPDETFEVFVEAGGASRKRTLFEVNGGRAGPSAGRPSGAAVGIAAGTAALPGLYFINDTDTGFYAPAAAQIGFAIDGAGELILTATELRPVANDGSGLGTATLSFADVFLATGAVINFNNGNLTLTHSAGTLTMSAGTVNLGASLIMINDTANAQMTVGLTINQGANDNEILAMKSSDVAHGATAITETDTYISILKASAVGGGMDFEVLSDADLAANTPTIIFQANSGVAADTTKSTLGRGVMELRAALVSGTGRADVGVNGNLISVLNNATARFFLDGEGDSHQDVGTAWTNFDDQDDLAVLNVLAAHVTRRDDPLRAGFAEWLKESRDPLEEMAIVHFNPDGHHFVNMSKLTMLHTGAIRQIGRQFQAYEERVAQLEGETVSMRKQLSAYGGLRS